MNIKEFYFAIGESLDSMLSRVLTEERAKKYVLMFKNDKTKEELDAAVKENNIENAFRAVHTLKGIAANLEFMKLNKASSDLTEILRHYNGEPFQKEYENVCKEYDSIIQNINLLD